jgi:hypothetical protein
MATETTVDSIDARKTPVERPIRIRRFRWAVSPPSAFKTFN